MSIRTGAKVAVVAGIILSSAFPAHAAGTNKTKVRPKTKGKESEISHVLPGSPENQGVVTLDLSVGDNYLLPPTGNDDDILLQPLLAAPKSAKPSPVAKIADQIIGQPAQGTDESIYVDPHVLELHKKTEAERRKDSFHVRRGPGIGLKLSTRGDGVELSADPSF